MTIDNPFYHRGAIRRPEEFYGREAEISQILGLLRNGQSVSLIGPRRIGKSSLLLHLARPQVRAVHNLGQPETLFVPIDCQEFGGSPPEEVYEALLSELLDRAGAIGVEIQAGERFGTYRALDRVLNQIYRQQINVVVLLDEFELLAANERLTPYFFARLRGLTTKYGLAYLTASQRPLFDITADEEILSSPFFNIFVTLPLGLYTEEEAHGLLAERLRGTGVEFSGALCDHLVHLAGPHPFFLHIAGYHAFQAVVQEKPLLQQNFAQLDAPIEVEADSHLGYLWHNLSPEEQYTLTIRDGPIDSLRLLEQQCLLEPARPSPNGEYYYTSELLRRYVRRQEVSGVIQAGPFVIDEQRHTVHAEGNELSLTTSQFDLFVRLTRDAGQVVHSADLETAVWGEVLINDPDRLKTLIKRLRRAIEPYDSWIISERGVGYTLRPPD
ncbi:MAG: winged helix-turn-helix domain-containing protein [Candidatus Promineifilaceae bacterium]|nr:winged helix-turn-helix domain-containing protein [Candidatus Promineifilaceae bacterium]